MGKTSEILLPDIGDFDEVEVIELLVSVGDRVSVEDSLLTLESDKATMEIPSPHAGVVQALFIKVGDRIGQDQKIATLELDDGVAETVSDQSVSSPAPAAEEIEAVQAPAPANQRDVTGERIPGEKAASAPPVSNSPAVKTARKAHASPAVRRFARELGVELPLVQGSGPKGRVTKDDVQGFVKKSLKGGQPTRVTGSPFEMPAGPEVDYARFGEIDAQPLGRIKKLSGAHLHRCWLTVPHVTQFDEADITDLETFRKAQKDVALKQDIRLTFMPFLMKAVAAALKEMPTLNAALSADGENLIYRNYIHIGVAVDTPNGLVVPVIRDVDKKGVFELAKELMVVSGRARDGKLLPADMQGGCFSISSLGGIGGTAFTPIVNAPEVAILGVSRAAMKPVWDGNAFQPRLMLPLSLSYDHRVVDGVDGVRFTTLLGGLLSEIRRLLL